MMRQLKPQAYCPFAILLFGKAITDDDSPHGAQPDRLYTLLERDRQI